MPRYDEETQKKALALAQKGTPLKEVQRQVGPNPSAIKRYAKKLGIKLPKKEAAQKKPAASKPAAKPATKPAAK